MKNKVFIILFFLFLSAPLVSNAIRLGGTNLAITVNATGPDATFDFKIQRIIGSNSQSEQMLSLITVNQTATGNVPGILGLSEYVISETVPTGYKFDNMGCTSANPENIITVNVDSIILETAQDSSITCTFNNKKVVDKTPVLIVPGLLGTDISKGDEKMWLDLQHNFSDVGDQFMDPLQFNQDLSPSDTGLNIDDVIGKEVANVGVGKITLFDYSDGLINEFKDQGYVEGETLFTFPYDWRYGVSGKFLDSEGNMITNSDLLKEKINEILADTGADKVDVIAHSMGGLIVKKYVVDHVSDNKIGKAVFVGVPNTGAPKAVKVLLQGDNFGIPWLAEEEMKKISANMPVAYDLLPSAKYFDVKGSFVETIGKTDPSTENLSGENVVKDLNYAETGDFLTGEHGLNSQALAQAESLHTADFDNFDLRTAGVNVFAINGCKAGTFSNLVETRGKDFLGNNQTEYSAKFSPGDNTVPLESAINLPIDEANKFYALVAEHGKMPSQQGIRQEIVNLIAGSSLSTTQQNGNPIITQDISKCGLNGKAISVFSPVNIFVTDQDGNTLGLAEDGSVQNEIPGADFEILGTHKFLFLPTDSGQIYTIGLAGTDTGTYTIKVDDILNNLTNKTEMFSDLPVTTDLTGRVILADSGTTLSIKQNADSEPVIVVADELKPKPVEAPQAVPVPVTTTLAPTVSGGGGMLALAPGVTVVEPEQQTVPLVVKKIISKITRPTQKQIAKAEIKKPVSAEVISMDAGTASLNDVVKRLGFWERIKNFFKTLTKGIKMVL